ncbi:MAG: chromosomal replication initiator protein DnaA [Deltaproteobacteria bacterium]|nr:chromosomal replication initiator protein DnaA [Deltaproteobacteria bacterium]
MSRPAPVETSPELAWQRARELLLTKFGPEAYQAGVEGLRFAGMDGDELRLVAPTASVASWMSLHHPGSLEEAMLAAGRACRISVLAAPRAQGELFPGETPVGRRRPIRVGALVPRYTFSTFVVGASNQFANAACKAVAAQPGHHYNPLFLYGGVGLGKTHLANAIGHATLEMNPEARVAYLSAEAFMTQLITALRRDRMEEFKSTFRRIDVLIIDDVQFLANRERTQEEFFHTFNALHEAHRQIILTSDTVPKDIPGLEERLRNRFEWGLIADLQPPDMETRVAILEKKAEIDGLDLPREVAIYLASKIDSNVRELEGCLTRLSAFASLSKTAITVDFARHVLHDLLRSRTTLSIEAIQQTVCEHYGIRLGDLLSKKRSRNIAFPRQVAMYLARKLTANSFPTIGARFDGRDHSTVIHAVNTIDRRLKNDERLRTALDELERLTQRKG